MVSGTRAAEHTPANFPKVLFFFVSLVSHGSASLGGRPLVARACASTHRSSKARGPASVRGAQRTARPVSSLPGSMSAVCSCFCLERHTQRRRLLRALPVWSDTFLDDMAMQSSVTYCFSNVSLNLGFQYLKSWSDSLSLSSNVIRTEPGLSSICP